MTEQKPTNKKLEIDVGKLWDGRYFLDIDQERVLTSKSLGKIVDKIEEDLKEAFGIEEKKSKIGSIFGR